MLPALDFDPAVEPPDAIGAVAVLGNHPLQPHQAGMAKQVRPDLALLEWRKVDAIDTASSVLSLEFDVCCFDYGAPSIDFVMHVSGCLRG